MGVEQDAPVSNLSRELLPIIDLFDLRLNRIFRVREGLKIQSFFFKHEEI